MLQRRGFKLPSLRSTFGAAVRLLRSAGPRRYAYSALEQGLASVLTLGASLALIRILAPASYGAFALWASVAFVLASVQNAISGVHLHSAPPSVSNPARQLVEQAMGRATCVFLVGVALIILALTLLGDGSFANPAAALFVPAFLLQQHTRAIAFSRGRAEHAALQAGAALLLGAATLYIGVVAGRLSSANDVLLGLGFAYGSTSGAAAFLYYYRRSHRALGKPVAYWTFARQSGWVFVGVLGSEILERFYVFAVGVYLGPVALALLAANQIILRPVPMLAGAICTAARPGLVTLREDGDMQGLRRFIARGLLLSLAVASTWGAIAWLSRGLIERYAFGSGQEVVSALLVLWTISAGLGFAQLTLNTSLQVHRRFAPLACVNLTASIVAGVAIVIGIHAMGARGAVVGMIVGQVVELTLMGWLLSRTLNTKSAQPLRCDAEQASSGQSAGNAA